MRAGWIGTATASALVGGGLLLLTASAIVQPAQAQYYGGGGFPYTFSPFPFFERSHPRRPARHRAPRHREREREPANVMAPPPLKPEVKAAKVGMIIGDSMAEWLAFGAEQAYAESPEIGVTRKVRASAGLVDHCNGEFRKWLEQSLGSEKPAFIAIMIGTNDRRPTKPCEPSAKADAAPTAALAFRSKEWAEVYGKEVDETIALLKSKGVPVFWVGLPAARNVRPADIGYLNGLYREHAQKAGIGYIDIWDAFVDEDGDFAMRGPDVNGQTRTLRAADGAHFTKAGARKLALYLEREVNRTVLHVQPSPPVSEAGSKPAPAKPHERPVAGPVVPLTRPPETSKEVLLGAPKQARGADDGGGAVESEAGRPAAGRADDFTWPRPQETVPGAQRDETLLGGPPGSGEAKPGAPR